MKIALLRIHSGLYNGLNGTRDTIARRGGIENNVKIIVI
jgi:hypothetical protein